MSQLAALLQQRDVHASRVVVLVPYAQLMEQARQAWLVYAASGGSSAAFVPRFETTMNWAASLAAADGGFLPAGDDIRLDAAIDVVTASSLLARAGLASQQGALAGRLVDTAWSLCAVASAQSPDHRLEWGARLGADLGAGMDSPALAFELALARIALVWASASAYQSDVLFTPQAGLQADLLVVLEGFQSEPLTEALKAHFDGRTASIPLTAPELPGILALHAAQDAEDEAHRAAACVMTHLAAGRTPTALIAQDRALTRRTRAMLAERGVRLRDETGWKLSTTRSAAGLMSLLRAMAWDAPSDVMLDWLKNAAAFDDFGVTRLEVAMRKLGIRNWRALSAADETLRPIGEQVTAIRSPMQKARPLAHWLVDLRLALQSAGQWKALTTDIAGKAVIEALGLNQPPDAAPHDESDVPKLVRLSLQEFTSWVNQSLEAASFSHEHADNAQVIILPLSQLLGRPLQAVVLPGADEVRLAVSPEPPGNWTATQRALLGLASRGEMAAAQRTAWLYALRMPQIDVLWRTSEAGERLMPSGFVQEVLLQQAPVLAKDPRTRRVLAEQPTVMPAPAGDALPVSRLSASAYEDLRRCPYRFFALRQLGLKEPEELESELGKREFGNWLHTLLNSFHEALKVAGAQDLNVRLAMINIAADEARVKLGLTDSEFLPFAAIWPRVREGYLQWLVTHEASGARFSEGEAWKEVPLGSLTLIGQLDRIDHLASGSRMVMDYKTEALDKTRERISNAQEDTQLAFYAALLEDDTLTAAYINLGENAGTKTFEQPDIVGLRDQLIDSILSDMGRIADGMPMRALGEGKACEYCAARGLCRKDFF